MLNEPPLSPTESPTPKPPESVQPAEHLPDLLEPEVVERIERVAEHAAVSVIKSELHLGPMPSPKSFGEYDIVLAGTSLVIRNEFQKNGEHVRAMEERGQAALIERDIKNRQTAERLVWASLALILILALTGHDHAAIAVSVTTVAAVITGFLRQRMATGKAKPADPEED
jgi:uncharacterized membrane protein